MAETVVMSLRIPSDLLKKVDMVAESQRRSRNSIVVLALEEYLGVRAGSSPAPQIQRRKGVGGFPLRTVVVDGPVNPGDVVRVANDGMHETATINGIPANIVKEIESIPIGTYPVEVTEEGWHKDVRTLDVVEEMPVAEAKRRYPQSAEKIDAAVKKSSIQKIFVPSPAPRDANGDVDWRALRLPDPPRRGDDQRDPMEILEDALRKDARLRPQVVEDETEPLAAWAWRVFHYVTPSEQMKAQVEAVYGENLPLE